MFQALTAPSSLSQIWKNAFQLAKARYRLIILMFIVFALMTYFNTYIVPPPPSTHISIKEALASIPAQSYGYMFIMGLINFYISMLIQHQLGITIEMQFSSVRHSAFIALKKLPLTFIGGLLFSLLTLLGFTIFVLPGIFLGLAILFLYPLILVDNMPLFAAIKRAIQLLWWHWWRTFAAFFIAGLLGIIVCFLCTIISGIILTLILMPFHFVANTKEITAIILSIVTIVIGSVFFFYLLAVVITQWHDLKLRYQQKVSAS